MPNLNQTYQSPFSFLAEQTKQPSNNGCGLAWIDNAFHLNGNNYFIYSCHSCQEKQIKKGKQPADYQWGGKHE